MALVVENGTGLSNANSYVSIAEADAYFVDTDPTWGLLTDPSKTTHLIKATRFIDGRYRTRFAGVRLRGRTQVLEWPRSGVQDIQGYPLQGVPIEIKNATCESALRDIIGDLIPDVDRGGMERAVTVGPIKIEYEPGAPGSKTYEVIDNMLSGIMNVSASVRFKR